MKILTSIIIGAGLVLAAVGTFFTFCLIKAMTIAWTIFLLITGALAVVFFAVTIPIHEYFTKRGSK